MTKGTKDFEARVPQGWDLDSEVWVSPGLTNTLLAWRKIPFGTSAWISEELHYFLEASNSSGYNEAEASSLGEKKNQTAVIRIYSHCLGAQSELL